MSAEIKVYMKCGRCGKYEAPSPSPDDRAETFRAVDSTGKIRYVAAPANWHFFTMTVECVLRAVVLCGDCVPAVAREVFK